MLFDLRGRRRRAVQATYLLLALLMGGGLVFFGIGGDVQGGLFDAFGERGGGGGNNAVQERIERNEERLATQPASESVLKALVRDYYAEAASRQESGATQFPEESQPDLRKSAAYWQRYLEAVDGDPDASLASLAIQIYDVGALNKPAEAQRAAAIVAEQAGDYLSYLRLVSYAAAAGDTRTADLATDKAVDLAPKSERKLVRQQAKALKKAATQPQGG